MALPTLGSILLGGVHLELARGETGSGFAYQPHRQSVLPGVAHPEEQQITHTPREFMRTVGWLDFSLGQGAAKQLPGERRLHYSEGPTVEMPGRIVRGHEIRSAALTTGSAAVSDFFEQNSILYVINGGYVRKITPTLNAETISDARSDGLAAYGDATGCYSSNIVFTKASPLWYDGTTTNRYLGTNAVADPIVRFDHTAADATKWVQDTDVAISYWALSRANDGQRLWGASCSDDTNGIYLWNLPQGSNPFTTGSWSTKFNLSNRAAAVTGIAALRDGIIATAADSMIYQFDYSSGVPTPLENEDGLISSSTAGKEMAVWNGILVVPGVRGLMLYDEQSEGPGTFVAIGPESMQGHEMPVRGQCTALYAGDPEWLWAAFYNGTDSHVWKGRRPRQGEEAKSRLIWDTGGVGKLASTQVTALHITHLGTNPILCIGARTAGGDPSVHFVTLPRNQMNVLQDGNCRSLITASSCFIPDHDAGAPTTTDVFRRARFKTIGCSASEYVNVYYRVDRGTFVLSGALETSPFAQVILPRNTTGGSLGLRLDFVGTTSLATFPQIEAITLDLTARPETARWIDVGVYAAFRQQTALGTSNLSGKEILDFLNRLADEDIITDLHDPSGAILEVQVDPYAGVHADIVEQLPDNRGPGWLIRFRLNVYDHLLDRPDAKYNASAYTGGTQASYWG